MNRRISTEKYVIKKGSAELAYSYNVNDQKLKIGGKTRFIHDYMYVIFRTCFLVEHTLLNKHYTQPNKIWFSVESVGQKVFDNSLVELKAAGWAITPVRGFGNLIR